jgi:hypothetical protein
VLPDIIIGDCFNHCEAHSKGAEIYDFLVVNHSLLDFGQAVLTHGITPEGLDYFGDEKYLDYERGYCFERARPLIKETVKACNITPDMGWWKAHNIVEMAIEYIVGSAGHYSDWLKSAFANHALVSEVGDMLQSLWQDKELDFSRRVERFVGFIELEKPGIEALAEKYRMQMWYRHGAEVNTKKIAQLIHKAAGIVSDDLEQFFQITSALVKDNLTSVNK